MPKFLIRKFVFEKLYQDSNSPVYWYKHHDIARLTAFFGSKEQYEELLTKDWKDFEKWDYLKDRSTSTYKAINYGYDIDKEDKEITFDDLKSYASRRGGKLLSNEYKQGNIYQTLEWENADGERFKARAYSVIRGGHWLNPLYSSLTWDFDRLAKSDNLIASYWYDSHEKSENHCYFMDDKYQALIK